MSCLTLHMTSNNPLDDISGYIDHSTAGLAFFQLCFFFSLERFLHVRMNSISLTCEYFLQL